MQVFIPYAQPIDVAQTLWNDQKRYNKQIIECIQILRAMDGHTAWSNHPVVKMYKNNRDWLVCYAKCLSSYRLFKETGDRKYIGEANAWNINADSCRPDFINKDEIIIQHRKRLYTKAPELYPQFSKYGISDINYYFVDGKILKYRNSKLIED